MFITTQSFNSPTHRGMPHFSTKEIPDTEQENWTYIRLKSMAEILQDPKCFFDTHGNLCREPGEHVAPNHFCHLGKEFHVKVGCGYSLPETDWLKRK